ncbi:MAG: hypothetical protein HY304_05075 [candidate division Zixibacteria bacterium]|nr:hypothetical protein [candidate division Zixibacteria bacterium]
MTTRGWPTAHVAVACNQCHATGFTGTSSACYACHEHDYTGVADPNHVSAGFSTVCTPCHTTSGWTPASLDHNITRFPLTGAHLAVACNQCHASGYTGTSTACVACHQTAATGVHDPDHTGLSSDCSQCHTTSGWKPATFDHNLTRFALTGAHQQVSCGHCHTNGYSGAPMQCDACHHTDYLGVIDPNHVSAGFSTDCASCHTTSGWKPASFDHGQTGFALTGAHRSVTCNSCHASGFTGTASACYACHGADYSGATNPNHALGNYPTLCEQCHTTSAWTPASYDHNLSGFPLTGAHTSVACNKCHITGFAGTPTACYACHAGDYTGVTDPNHVAAGFPTTCQRCHSTTGWIPASFDHSQSGFPLTGAHTTLSCNRCHANGYTGTPMECLACHGPDYDGATPDHTAAGFPTTCQTCHTTVAWKPANWDHDAQYFPIYSGAHKDKWGNCSECHVDPANYATFECILCHEHNQTSMDDKHKEEQGYHYLSTACYSCHPRGRH